MKDEKLSYFGNSRKYPSFKEGEEGHEKPTYKGRLPEMGGGSLDSLQILGEGGLGKKVVGGVFDWGRGEVDIPMNTM